MLEYTIRGVDPESPIPAAVQAGLYAADPVGIPARDHAALALAAYDTDGQLVGGLLGATMWGWLTIDTLWVAVTARGVGLGGRLLVAAETAALGRECAHARLDTFDFQARAFYERHGYTLYGQLADFPPGHVQYHFRKALVSGVAPAA